MMMTLEEKRVKMEERQMEIDADALAGETISATGFVKQNVKSATKRGHLARVCQSGSRPAQPNSNTKEL